MPVSTTHSLVGALIGSGWAAGSAINFARLGSGFFAPLVISPFLAVAAAIFLYPALTRVRRGWGISSEACLCVGNETVEIALRGTILSRLTEPNNCPFRSVMS